MFEGDAPIPDASDIDYWKGYKKFSDGFRTLIDIDRSNINFKSALEYLTIGKPAA